MHKAHQTEQKGTGPRRPSLEWIAGRVAAMRRKFSVGAAHGPVPTTCPVQKQVSTHNPPSSPPPAPRPPDTQTIAIPSASVAPGLDGDLVTLCANYRRCAANKFTKISEPFDELVARFAVLYLREPACTVDGVQIQVHRGASLPRGMFMFPLNRATGECLIDFGEVAGFSIGRGCRLVKQPNPLLSRSHCLIYMQNGGVLVEDCDSQSGTFLNGKLLGSSVSTPLRSFDVIQLGYPVKETTSMEGTETAVQFAVIFLDSWEGKRAPSLSITGASPQAGVASPASTMKMCKTMSVASLPLSPSRAFEADDDEHVPEYSFVHLPYQPGPVSPSLLVNSPLSPKLSEITTTVPPKASAFTPAPMVAPILESPLGHSQPKAIEPSSPIKSLAVDHKLPANPPPIPSRSPKSDPSSSGMPLSEILEAIKSGSSTKSATPTRIPAQGKKNLSRSLNDLLQGDPSLVEVVSPVKQDIQKTRSHEDLNRDERLKQVIELLPPDVVIPCISPLYTFLFESNRFKPAVLSFQLKTSTKRFDRIEHGSKSKKGALGPSILAVDFGLLTTDISDGAAIIQHQGDSLQCRCVFNNYRGAWQCESIKGSIRIIVEPDVFSHAYKLAVSWTDYSQDRVTIATIKFDKRRRSFGAYIDFSISDEDFARLCGEEDNNKVPLSLVHRLACYRDKMRPPALSIQGVPSVDYSISVKGESNNAMGSFKVSRTRANWTHHSMLVDLDLSKEAPPDSIYNAAVETVVLLYCLVYYY